MTQVLHVALPITYGKRQDNGRNSADQTGEAAHPTYDSHHYGQSQVVVSSNWSVCNHCGPGSRLDNNHVSRALY